MRRGGVLALPLLQQCVQTLQAELAVLLPARVAQAHQHQVTRGGVVPAAPKSGLVREVVCLLVG